MVFGIYIYSSKQYTIDTSCEVQVAETCFNCGHEFCFLCHADRTAIKAHGNHYHQPTCRYHFIYAPWRFILLLYDMYIM